MLDPQAPVVPSVLAVLWVYGAYGIFRNVVAETDKECWFSVISRLESNAELARSFHPANALAQTFFSASRSMSNTLRFDRRARASASVSTIFGGSAAGS